MYRAEDVERKKGKASESERSDDRVTDKFPRRKKDSDGEVNRRNNDSPWSAPNGFLIHKRVNSQLN